MPEEEAPRPRRRRRRRRRKNQARPPRPPWPTATALALHDKFLANYAGKPALPSDPIARPPRHLAAALVKNSGKLHLTFITEVGATTTSTGFTSPQLLGYEPHELEETP